MKKVLLLLLLLTLACCCVACKSSSTGLEAGTVVTYGRYEQDNDDTNGAEPIEWIVLATEDKNVLLISRYGLDTQEYHRPSIRRGQKAMYAIG